MRPNLVCLCLGLSLVCSAWAQQATEKQQSTEKKTATTATDKTAATSDESQLQAIFESKIKAEWEAIKKKDKQAYGALLADDYQGVEIDGQGERTKIQAMMEVASSNVSDYTLSSFKLISLGPEAAFVIYESTMQFPPKSVLRFSRVYITELWVKRNGEWKELHYQETHVK